MLIGPVDLDREVLIVAEIGNNHEGSFARAEEMIGRAAEAGVQAVKFQTIVPDDWSPRIRVHGLPPFAVSSLPRRSSKRWPRQPAQPASCFYQRRSTSTSSIGLQRSFRHSKSRRATMIIRPC